MDFGGGGGGGGGVNIIGSCLINIMGLFSNQFYGFYPVKVTSRRLFWSTLRGLLTGQIVDNMMDPVHRGPSSGQHYGPCSGQHYGHFLVNKSCGFFSDPISDSFLVNIIVDPF